MDGDDICLTADGIEIDCGIVGILPAAADEDAAAERIGDAGDFFTDIARADDAPRFAREFMKRGGEAIGDAGGGVGAGFLPGAIAVAAMVAVVVYLIRKANAGLSAEYALKK